MDNISFVLQTAASAVTYVSLLNTDKVSVFMSD